MPYVVKASHDGRLYELPIPEVQIPKCSICGELVFSNIVDDQISRMLRSRLCLLTPEEIHEARTRLGLSPKELAQRLGTTEECLDGWEEGTVFQPRSMDNLLRVFFALSEVRSMLTGANQDPNVGLQLNQASR